MSYPPFTGNSSGGFFVTFVVRWGLRRNIIFPPFKFPVVVGPKKAYDRSK